MPALKSNNPTNAQINKNFVIRIKKADQKGTFLVSANKYRQLLNEKLAQKHFKKVLEGGLDNYTFKLRKRLIINFHGK